ncbi:hypothetical protein DIZ27_42840 [Streptomyces sp. NWU339]|nr:hypothetical protein DIZ27_42840 [Streptomyces sp. NWU339]
MEHRLFSHISMNWRGRPLTSHEVMVQSIAATTTRTGLKVRAELDTGTYDTGVKVTDAEIDMLPMARHRFHGDWNYTLHPAHPHPGQNRHKTTGRTGSATAPAPGRPDPASLGDPELTGMTVEQLNLLITELIPALEEQRERFRSRQRGGERLRARGAGAKDKLSAPGRILATVLYRRKLGTHELLAGLFGVTRSTLSRAVQEVQPLLAKHGQAIRPSTARFRTPADVAAFLAAEPGRPESKPAC